MRLPPAEEIQISNLLQIFLEAYSNKDLNTMMSCFTRDPDTIVVGPGESERLMGPTLIRNSFSRDLHQADNLNFQLTWHVISGRGEVGWVTAEVYVEITVQGFTTSVKGRWTLVVENRGGFWLIRQSHFSAPAGSEAEEEYY